jgi:hypothetical protein
MQSAQFNVCLLVHYHVHPVVYQPYLLLYTTGLQILVNQGQEYIRQLFAHRLQ